jgi:hypothetical protein
MSRICPPSTWELEKDAGTAAILGILFFYQKKFGNCIKVFAFFGNSCYTRQTSKRM